MLRFVGEPLRLERGMRRGARGLRWSSLRRLRREHRRVDAREQLRTAHEMLSTMGVEAFADRARRELLATGETVRKRRVETRGDLTAQETQIARLARDGLTNPEIGAQLFISPRTVQYHLRKVFLNLGAERDFEGALVGLGKSLDVEGIAEVGELDAGSLRRICRAEPDGPSAARPEEHDLELEVRDAVGRTARARPRSTSPRCRTRPTRRSRRESREA
jgi:DNA-binding CsgD family transcriptional regulator